MTIMTKLLDIHQQFCSKGDNFILHVCEIIRKAKSTRYGYKTIFVFMVDFYRSWLFEWSGTY